MNIVAVRKLSSVSGGGVFANEKPVHWNGDEMGVCVPVHTEVAEWRVLLWKGRKRNSLSLEDGGRAGTHCPPKLRGDVSHSYLPRAVTRLLRHGM